MINLKKIVEKANIDYHTTFAEIYDTSQPHFKLENQKQVQELIEKYAKQSGKERLLDLGCGTGFILELAKNCFNNLYGIDITPAMLNLAKEKFNKENVTNIQLLEASSDKIPFPENYFNVVSGYSFLHHLPNLNNTLKESYRVLKKGGTLFTDLDPNYYFWQSMKEALKLKNVSPALKTEINSICDMPGDVQKIVKGLKTETIKKSEYIESSKGGFKEEQLYLNFKKAGFNKINIHYHWFWQEGKIIRDLSLKNALYFEDHLREALPTTRSLFKYIRIVAIK